MARLFPGVVALQYVNLWSPTFLSKPALDPGVAGINE